jgi:hypothetical protein
MATVPYMAQHCSIKLMPITHSLSTWIPWPCHNDIQTYQSFLWAWCSAAAHSTAHVTNTVNLWTYQSAIYPHLWGALPTLSCVSPYCLVPWYQIEAQCWQWDFWYSSDSSDEDKIPKSLGEPSCPSGEGIILRPHWAGTPMIMWMFRWAIFVHLCLACSNDSGQKIVHCLIEQHLDTQHLFKPKPQ